ncbi:hypothetical protein MTP99_012664 [Tenebrio molitor]|nr:hypothetical protein MTP99_012664 [Tenebrio molitor]
MATSTSSSARTRDCDDSVVAEAPPQTFSKWTFLQLFHRRTVRSFFAGFGMLMPGSPCQKASAKGEGDSWGRYTVTATVRHLARRSLGLLFITPKTIAR